MCFWLLLLYFTLCISRKNSYSNINSKNKLKKRFTPAWTLRLPQNPLNEVTVSVLDRKEAHQVCKGAWKKYSSFNVAVPLILQSTNVVASNDKHSEHQVSLAQQVIHDCLRSMSGRVMNGELLLRTRNKPAGTKPFHYSVRCDVQKGLLSVSFSSTKLGFDTVLLSFNDFDSSKSKSNSKFTSTSNTLLELAVMDAHGQPGTAVSIQLGVVQPKKGKSKAKTDSLTLRLAVSESSDSEMLEHTSLLKILAILETILKTQLADQMGVTAARRAMQVSYEAERAAAKEKARAKALDRIENPQKYKRIRPGSGNSHKGVDGGRYRPSADARARRVVQTRSS